jgi:hypothetical protein
MTNFYILTKHVSQRFERPIVSLDPPHPLQLAQPLKRVHKPNQFLRRRPDSLLPRHQAPPSTRVLGVSVPVPVPTDLDRSEEGSGESKLVLFKVSLDGGVVSRVKGSVVGAMMGRVSALLAERDEDVSSVGRDSIGRMRDRIVEDHAKEGFGDVVGASLLELSKEVVDMGRGRLMMEKVMTGRKGNGQPSKLLSASNGKEGLAHPV